MHGYLPNILSFAAIDALLSFVETGVVTVLDTVTLVGFCNPGLVGTTCLGTSVAVGKEVAAATLVLIATGLYSASGASVAVCGPIPTTASELLVAQDANKTPSANPIRTNIVFMCNYQTESYGGQVSRIHPSQRLYYGAALLTTTYQTPWCGCEHIINALPQPTSIQFLCLYPTDIWPVNHREIRLVRQSMLACQLARLYS